MSRTDTPWGPWEPATPAEVAQIFNSSQARWWIAGGYAIELAAGRPVREHTDIDVLLLRSDQLAVQRVLPDWQWHAADPPGTMRPWQPDELLPDDVHDFAVMLPMLTQSQRQWLIAALKLAYGPDHAWLGRLHYAENVC